MVAMTFKEIDGASIFNEEDSTQYGPDSGKGSARKVTITIGTVDGCAIVVLRQVSEEWGKFIWLNNNVWPLASKVYVLSD